MQDLVKQVAMAGVSLTRLMYYYSNGNKASAQGKTYFLQELERPLEVPKVGDMVRPTPASKELCQGEMVKDRNPSIPKMWQYWIVCTCK